MAESTHCGLIRWEANMIQADQPDTAYSAEHDHPGSIGTCNGLHGSKDSQPDQPCSQ